MRQIEEIASRVNLPSFHILISEWPSHRPILWFVLYRKREMWLETMERRQRESERSYELFILYRDMAKPRSLEDMHRICTGHAPKIDAFKKMSARNKWVERCQDLGDDRFY